MSFRFQSESSEHGGAMLEFAVSSLVWLPLLTGVAIIGFNILRAIQVSQLSRDCGHMFAYGVDFSDPQNTTLLQRMTAPLQILDKQGSATSTGAVVLSRITYVTDLDCQAAGPSNPCLNRNQYVFTNIFVYGNHGSDYAQTKMGNPGATFFPSGRAITQNDYLNNPGLIATNFSQYLKFDTTIPGQCAFVSEVTSHPVGTSWAAVDDLGSYARSIF